MKIENKEVTIKIGNKTKTFKNLILNSYLDLFADSFLDFKEKNLPYCLVNFTKANLDINENSSIMQYDTILEADFSNNVEILTDSNIINKYFYETPVGGYPYLENFKGQTIKQLGFANYDYTKQDYVLYAFIDVSKYGITIQDNQPVIISRVDKITSDMKFWSNDTRIKAPYHLTGRGLLGFVGMEYQRIIPKLYSVGVGVLPYVFTQEFLAEDLDIQRKGVGGVVINKSFINVAENDLYPSPELFPSPDLYLQKPTANLLIYKFKMFIEHYEDPSEPPVLVDTGLFYVQYKEINNFGVIEKLKINYERG